MIKSHPKGWLFCNNIINCALRILSHIITADISKKNAANCTIYIFLLLRYCKKMFNMLYYIYNNKTKNHIDKRRRSYGRYKE